MANIMSTITAVSLIEPDSKQTTNSQVPPSRGARGILDAAERLKKVVTRTPLLFNQNLSRTYNCNVYLKREDLQIVRSYKLRGAYNMMSSLPSEQIARGVVCASAGNHAQGFAYSCKKLHVKGVVFMPIITPKQKVNQTRMKKIQMREYFYSDWKRKSLKSLCQ